MIGTISIAESIKENPEIHIAEKPKPLNPLIIETRLKKSFYSFFIKSAHNVDRTIKAKKNYTN